MAVISNSFKEQLYRPIHSEDIGSEPPDTSRFIVPKSCQKSYLRLVAPWIASTFSLALITGYLLFQQRNSPAYLATSLPAFQTDIHDAHPYISYEERVFSGRLAFDEEIGKVYRDIDLSAPQYFGLPSPEIDDAWADLMRGEFVRMTDEEAAPYTPELNKAPHSDDYHFE
ncbi:hypothetical protein N7463_005054 [Penicillium fimorum]|uniref:Uncharacterized protein n=1 Tax=Penicillium fimorum TaxID=1882269 RepID=A0A9W9XRS0_9EURO|nr:hypothetical protein N7463_005054 [Penicillium fimorum]